MAEQMITLRELFDEKFKGLEREIRAQGENTGLRFDALDTALNLARADAKDKYEHLNALRGEVITDRGIMVRNDTCKQTHAGTTKDITDVKREISLLREAKSQTDGRVVEKAESRTQSNWSTGLTVVTILSSLSLIMMAIHLVKG